jgi:peptidoglycan/xylan/chitin deacetylase (PgdA/CDA1 family)
LSSIGRRAAGPWPLDSTRPTSTSRRFHVVVLVAAILIATAVGTAEWWLLYSTLAAFLAVTGLGVAIPRLRFFGPYICRGDSLTRQVALTFDDGPDPRSTPALLEVLHEHGVEVAFFAIGEKVEAEPELANDILRAGHLLENHSHRHSNATNFYLASGLTAELIRAQQAIERHTGTTPRFFRPPLGLSNAFTFGVAAALGLNVIGWSNRGFDTRITDPERIVRRIERGLRPGAIILLHDGNIPADRLVATVKLLLARLQEHGYDVVRLDRMLT